MHFTSFLQIQTFYILKLIQHPNTEIITIRWLHEYWLHHILVYWSQQISGGEFILEALLQERSHQLQERS